MMGESLATVFFGPAVVLGASGGGVPPGYSPPAWWSFLPFVLLLLAIAVLPLVHATHHWWERNRNKLIVAVALAMATVLYYWLVHPGIIDHDADGRAELVPRGWHAVAHVLDHAVLKDFVPFIVLLFSLYTISGGIFLRGNLPAHPGTNTGFLAAGAVLASFIGTTGASMLLIRPLLRTNQERRHVVHTVIFFIFTVSNTGGLLTPLGDPPLFLGYLRGVPFWWTMALVPEWLLVNAALLTLYFALDAVLYRRERARDIARDEARVETLGIDGAINFLWLLGVVACVATLDSSRPVPGTAWKPFPYFRELVLLGLTAASWLLTRGNAEIRKRNHFDFNAIGEVACLFIGIFICMQAPVEFLRVKGPELPLAEAWHFFWATGLLSSFLDNAPTYVVFFETARSLAASLDEAAVSSMLKAGDLVALGEPPHIAAKLLIAVSLGSVFMGANTYIGNGPNFMVKSIAESRKVKMPSFFGYMLWSAGILIPLFVAVTFLFLR
jgi:Na+/H+ antiporter NhaD/arsenite permease-like protein